MDALIEAIISGRLSHRQARIALAIATGGRMGARRLAAVTGIDRAHCVRTLSELKALGWITRDGDGARPVDNSTWMCAEKAHGMGVPKEHPCAVSAHGECAEKAHVCQKSTLMGVPKKHTCAEKAHPLEPAPDAASSQGVLKKHTPNSSSSSIYNNTTTTIEGEVSEKVLVFPKCFTPDQKAAARRMLAPLNSRAQELLDEIAGREAIHTIRNPLAYLRGLIRRAQTGDFILEAGVAVAEARRRHEAIQRARKESEEAHLTEIKHLASRYAQPYGSFKEALAAFRRGHALA